MTEQTARRKPFVVRRVPLLDVYPDYNDRRHFAPEATLELALSIKDKGLIQPLTVRPDGAGKFVIVAGGRRYRAYQLLASGELADIDTDKFQDVPCILRDDLTDEQAAEMMLAENTAREDLLPMEEAEAYQHRIETYGWSVQRVAEVAGVSQQRVRGRLLLLDLCPEARELIDNGSLPTSHGEIMRVLPHDDQRELLRSYVKKPLGKTSLQLLVNELIEKSQQATMFDLETVYEKRIEIDKGNHPTDFQASEDYPVEWVRGMNAFEVAANFVAQLQERGQTGEADAVNSLMAELLNHRLIKPPRHTRV